MTKAVDEILKETWSGGVGDEPDIMNGNGVYGMRVGMSAYRVAFGFRCHVCNEMVEFLARESWTVLPRDAEGRPRGICEPCWANPPTMRVFEAVAEGALTPEQGAALLVRKREPTWWQRVFGFLFGVLDNHVSRFP